MAIAARKRPPSGGAVDAPPLKRPRPVKGNFVRVFIGKGRGGKGHKNGCARKGGNAKYRRNPRYLTRGGGRGRGRGRGGGHGESNEDGVSSHPGTGRGACYRCGGGDHWAAHCPTAGGASTAVPGAPPPAPPLWLDASDYSTVVVGDTTTGASGATGGEEAAAEAAADAAAGVGSWGAPPPRCALDVTAAKVAASAIAAAAKAAAAPSKKAVAAAAAAAARAIALAPLVSAAADAVRSAANHPPDSDECATILGPPLAALMGHVWGHATFRPGQLPALARVLRPGGGALAILPTGAGKSLLYQLPALVLGGTVLVVSPLLALMADQLARLPPELPGAMLASWQPPAEARATLARLRAGELRILLVSPERLASSSFRSLLAGLPPPAAVTFVAVDEAHCVTDWGHNFRPSYARLGGAIRDTLGSPVVVALTATATTATAAAISATLALPPGSTVRMPCVRHNLALSASLVGGALTVGRDPLLAPLLAAIAPHRGGAADLANTKSAIIYCSFQSEADAVAALVYRETGVRARAYHAGKPAGERARTQADLCSGKLGVVAATVAFGMGLDKRDLGAVVHLGMPRSLEEYVQQVGRVGRDGRRDAPCHLLFAERPYRRLRSLAFTEGVDAPQVAAFLTRLLTPPAVRSTHPGAAVYTSVPLESTCIQLDIKAEVLDTLLCYLESDDPTGDGAHAHHPGPLVRVMQPMRGTVSLAFHDKPADDLAARVPLVDAALKVYRAGGAGGVPRSCPRGGRWPIPATALATALGVSLDGLSTMLASMQSAGAASYELSERALVVELLPGTLGPQGLGLDSTALTSLSQSLASRLAAMERRAVGKLDAMWDAATTTAAAGGASEQRGAMEAAIRAYFEDDEGCTQPQGGTGVMNSDAADGADATGAEPPPVPAPAMPPIDPTGESRFLRSDIRVLLQSAPARGGKRSAGARGGGLETGAGGPDGGDGGWYGVGGWTPRAVARILHGLGSPAFPASDWAKQPMWGRHADTDFVAVKRAAAEEMAAAGRR